MSGSNQKQFHAVSLSGGKDSTAMLLLMIERGMPIDMVLYADTGMEFPEMYAHIAKLDAYLYEQRGIHITILRHPQGFEYLMFDEPKTKPKSIENRVRLGVPLFGNGWPGIRVRWCTGALKTKLIDKEVKRLKGELGAIHYIGIAADEAWRCKGEKYPLVEWGIMSIYNTGTRLGLMQALSEMRTYLGKDEQELRDLTDSAIEKLRHMTDAEYEALDLMPDFGSEDADAV